MEVLLMETYQGKLRSYAAARAGINTMLDLMQKQPSSKDTLYAAAVHIDPTDSPQWLFSYIPFGDHAYAKIQWFPKNFNTSSTTPQAEYGIIDEQGRININGINTGNYQILSALFELKGLSRSDADKLAQGIIDYSGVHALGPGIRPKKGPYQNVLELLEVEGMSQDIFNSIKDDVTVYGDNQNGLWINTATASNDVIAAVANAAARLNPSINASDITSQAYAVRDGADGQSFTEDDGATEVASMANPSWPPALRDGKSHYYRIHAVGVDTISRTQTIIEAVVHYTQAGCRIIAWQRS